MEPRGGNDLLDWLEAPTSARWLDVGCGTGAFTRLILERCSPASIVAVDPAVAQVAHAVSHRLASGNFGVADAQALPFADQAFDVAVAALVLNFVPDVPRAIEELQRVTARHGVVAGYVWDFAAELSPTWPLRAALREDRGRCAASAWQPVLKHCQAYRIVRATFETVCARSIEAVVRFRDFADYWECQTVVVSPLTGALAALTDDQRLEVMAIVRCNLQGSSGELSYAAYANAVKGVVA